MFPNKTLDRLRVIAQHKAKQSIDGVEFSFVYYRSVRRVESRVSLLPFNFNK